MLMEPVDNSMMDLQIISDEPLEFRRRLPLAVFGGLCALVAYLWFLSSDLFNFSLESLPLKAAGLLAIILILLDLRLGLGIVLLTIGISPEFQLWGISNIRAEDFLLPILALSWLIHFTIKKERLLPTELKIPILLIFFLSLFSSIFNLIYHQIDPDRCLFRLIKCSEYFLIFIITLNVVRRESDIRKFAYLCVVAGSMVGIYGIFQSFHLQEKVTGPPGETANIIGGYYAFHVCLAIGLITNLKKHRLILTLGLALMLYPLLNTMGRTSYIALFGSLLAMFAVRHNLWSVLIALSCGLVILSSSNIYTQFATILGIFQGNLPPSLEARLLGWENFLGYLPQAPLLGYGLGRLDLGAFDNEYVRLFFELGLLGLLVFLWMLWRILRTSYCLSREPIDPTLRGFAFGCFGGTMALLIHSLGAPSFTTIRTAEPFFLAIGILYAIAWRVGSGPSIDEELPAKLPIPLQKTGIPSSFHLKA